MTAAGWFWQALRRAVYLFVCPCVFLAAALRALLGPPPCWAAISETQVALNEARRVGMGPQQTQARSDPSSSLLAPALHVLSLPLSPLSQAS